MFLYRAIAKYDHPMTKDEIELCETFYPNSTKFEGTKDSVSLQEIVLETLTRPMTAGDVAYTLRKKYDWHGCYLRGVVRFALNKLVDQGIIEKLELRKHKHLYK
jgi:hypothetical protein